jgi:hypothetical protein
MDSWVALFSELAGSLGFEGASTKNVTPNLHLVPGFEARFKPGDENVVRPTHTPRPRSGGSALGIKTS